MECMLGLPLFGKSSRQLFHVHFYHNERFFNRETVQVDSSPDKQLKTCQIQKETLK